MIVLTLYKGIPVVNKVIVPMLPIQCDKLCHNCFAYLPYVMPNYGRAKAASRSRGVVRDSKDSVKSEPEWTPEEGYKPVRLRIRTGGLRAGEQGSLFERPVLPTRCEVHKEVQISEQTGIPYVPEVRPSAPFCVPSLRRSLSASVIRGSPGASSGHEPASSLSGGVPEEGEISESEGLRPPALERDPDDRWAGPSSQHKVGEGDAVSPGVHDEVKQCCVSGPKGKLPCSVCLDTWTQELMSEVEPVAKQQELYKTPPRSYSLEELYEESDIAVSSVPSSSQSSVSPGIRKRRGI